MRDISLRCTPEGNEIYAFILFRLDVGGFDQLAAQRDPVADVCARSSGWSAITARPSVPRRSLTAST